MSLNGHTYTPDVEIQLPVKTRKRKTKNKLASEQVSSTAINYSIKKILPKTETQRLVFDSYRSGANLFLHGFPGTGKTFLSVFLALHDVLYQHATYKKVIIIRSAVPSRDLGFLPGTKEEKIAEYEAPYVEQLTELFGKSTAYEQLKQKGIVEFECTSFLRGRTFSDCIIIVDECQNMVFSELNTIMTRIGENCKIVFCGDLRQTDLRSETEKKACALIMDIVRSMKSFDFIEFRIDDIVRSNLVKEYIIAASKLGVF